MSQVSMHSHKKHHNNPSSNHDMQNSPEIYYQRPKTIWLGIISSLHILLPALDLFCNGDRIGALSRFMGQLPGESSGLGQKYS